LFIETQVRARKLALSASGLDKGLSCARIQRDDTAVCGDSQLLERGATNYQRDLTAFSAALKPTIREIQEGAHGSPN
jgi:hypothetical protein